MGVYEDLHNPDLFEVNVPGNYQYTGTAYGKIASGQLTLATDIQRDSAAQRAAGGEDRRTGGNPYGIDDGGHLVGARFAGSVGEENLTPQDRNLNRGQYKGIENGWAEHLNAGDKVYVHIESYTGDGSNRPTSYMGYAIIEHTDQNGQTTRDVEFFSVNNESRAEQARWDQAEEGFYREHPEEVAKQMRTNTAMPYIWNEETGKVEPNPYFDPANASAPASGYAPEKVAENTPAIVSDSAVEGKANNGAQENSANTADHATKSTVSYTPEEVPEDALAIASDYVVAIEANNGAQENSANTADHATESTVSYAPEEVPEDALAIASDYTTEVEADKDTGNETDAGVDMY